MRRKVTLLILALLSIALLGTGCATRTEQSGFQQSQGFNLAGIVSFEKQSFTPPKSTQLRVRSSEVANRNVFYGDRLSLLWGLITIDDY